MDKNEKKSILDILKENLINDIAFSERKKNEVHDLFDTLGWNQYGQFVIDLVDKIKGVEDLNNLEKDYLLLLIGLEARKKIQDEVSTEDFR